MKQFSRHLTIAAILLAIASATSTARAGEIPLTNPMSGDEKAIKEGKSWFRNTCSPCHGGRADGAGERGTAADLRVFNKGFRKFVYTVQHGKDTGRTMTMPAWGAVLDEKTIFQIGAYIETLAIEGANWKEGVAQQ